MEKMTPAFYEWLKQCPVDWLKTGDNRDFVTYSFCIPYAKEEEE